MTVITNNSITGINSITAQASTLNFYDSTGSQIAIGASVTGDITGNLTGNVTGIVTATGGSITGVSTIGTTNLTVNGNAYPATGPLSNRNLIINGAMQAAQRGTSATSPGYQTVDRFTLGRTLGDATFSISQDSSGPSGFSKCLEVDITAAETSVAAGEYINIQHKIEAQNLQQLDYGTSDAKQVTLSFWVRSSVTGTYAVTNFQQDGNRIIGATYTIDSANTWEYKTIAFTGDTGGTINNDNGEGFRLYWWLSAGSDFTSTDNTSWGSYELGKLAYGHTANDFVTTLNANWRITGVQLEVGSVATPFEHRSFSDELAKCQRYYYRVTSNNDHTIAVGYNQNTSATRHMTFFPVTMRVQPSALEQSGTASDYSIYHGTTITVCTSVPIFTNCTTHCAEVQATASSSLTAGQGSLLSMESTGYLAWSAEL